MDSVAVWVVVDLAVALVGAGAVEGEVSEQVVASEAIDCFGMAVLIEKN